MKTWIIEGADRNTGETRTIKVLAQDEQEAERMATARDVFPSRISVHSEADQRPKVKASAKPPLTETAHAALRLRTADRVLSLFGYVYIGLAIFIAILALWMTLADGLSHPAKVEAVIYFLVGLCVGILLLGAGAALRMLAIIGERSTLVR